MSEWIEVDGKFHNVNLLEWVDAKTMDRINELGKPDHAVVAHLKWLVRAAYEEGYRTGCSDEFWRKWWDKSKAKEYLG